MKPSDVRELPPRVMSPRAPAAPRSRSVTLAADCADTGRVARRTARRVVGDWRLPVSADDVELAVSELVGNAVHHATRYASEGRVTVVFRAWSRWLLVEVADESPNPPAFPVGAPLSPQPFGLAEGGRGLFLVGCLADGVWWSARESGGKSVFCRFRFENVDSLDTFENIENVENIGDIGDIELSEEPP